MFFLEDDNLQTRPKKTLVVRIDYDDRHERNVYVIQVNQSLWWRRRHGGADNLLIKITIAKHRLL
jgi:hypothetical protein